MLETSRLKWAGNLAPEHERDRNGKSHETVQAEIHAKERARTFIDRKQVGIGYLFFNPSEEKLNILDGGHFGWFFVFFPVHPQVFHSENQIKENKSKIVDKRGKF
jgi:hypothetical protein